MDKQIDMILSGAKRRKLFEGPIVLLDDPDGVLKHPWMSTEEKRALLASWASDAYAVQDHPTLRRLDNGTVIPVDDILSALKALDEEQGEYVGIRDKRAPWRQIAKGRNPLREVWQRLRRASDDDDDDPPPCPAVIRPRLNPGQGGVDVVAERQLEAA